MIIVIRLHYRKDYRRPVNSALAGIVINLTLTCAHLLLQTVLVTYVPQQSYPVVIASFSLFSAVGGVVVLSLLLIAVFIDRDPLRGFGACEDDLGGMPVVGQPTRTLLLLRLSGPLLVDSRAACSSREFLVFVC